jgi:signal transduction histidine kinase
MGPAAVLDALDAPVVVTDVDGTVIFANRAAITLLGADKYVGAALAETTARGEVLGPGGEPLGWAEHPVARVLATGSPVLGARLTVRYAGIDRTCTVKATPVLSGERLVGAACVFHPSTVSGDLGADIADHAARLEAIVNLVSEGVFTVDASGRLTFSNAVGQRLLRLPLGASIGERLRLAKARDADGDPLRADELPSSRALAGESVTGFMLLVDDAQGTQHHLVTSAHPLRRADGSIYAALLTMKEITDEVQAREELEAARETAEEANHLKDQFIAALSHELRTPLQPILGWTEVLRRHGNLDPVTSQALEAIRRNIRQQVRLVDDLLDLSRIVHGKLSLRFETFDLRDQVRSAAEPFEEAAALKRVRLVLTLPTEGALMWGDGARVQQIASNLISNAVKFTPTGGQINVQLVVGPSEALLEVEDTGEGIAPEEMPLIFEPFGQGSSSRRRGGLGIGLNLVRRLTELHGGTVEAYSEGRGYGARFQVRLPLRTSKVAPIVHQTPANRRLDRSDILIIEDNADTRAVMKYMLEAEGACVETADSGEAGIGVALERRPQVILCDIGLPDIDGLEVARRVRRYPGLDRTRLIALTGYGQPEDVRHALDAGFEAHLTKPINVDQLLSLLAGE